MDQDLYFVDIHVYDFVPYIIIFIFDLLLLTLAIQRRIEPNL